MYDLTLCLIFSHPAFKASFL